MEVKTMASRDTNPTQGFGASGDQLDWNFENAYWRNNWSSRPYAAADRGYGYYEPGYRYGVESARRHRGRDWNDVEPELRSGWDSFEHRGQSTWENIKGAVRDAWDRVTNR
jgi:hypothetical protein